MSDTASDIPSVYIPDININTTQQEDGRYHINNVEVTMPDGSIRSYAANEISKMATEMPMAYSQLVDRLNNNGSISVDNERWADLGSLNAEYPDTVLAIKSDVASGSRFQVTYEKADGGLGTGSGSRVISSVTVVTDGVAKTYTRQEFANLLESNPDLKNEFMSNIGSGSGGDISFSMVNNGTTGFVLLGANQMPQATSANSNLEVTDLIDDLEMKGLSDSTAKAFSVKEASLLAQMQLDETGVAAERYNKLMEDKQNINALAEKIQGQIDTNNQASTWNNVPKGIAQAEQRDMNSQLQQQKADAQKFGVAVANMTPQERQNLDNFFTLVNENPEAAKQLVASAKAKEASEQARAANIGLVDKQIADNNAPGAWQGVSKNIARAEQADMNMQLQQQKADLAAAPLDSDVDPSLVSELNPTGSIQKDKDLKAFFAAAQKAEAEKKASSSLIDT